MNSPAAKNNFGKKENKILKLDIDGDASMKIKAACETALRLPDDFIQEASPDAIEDTNSYV